MSPPECKTCPLSEGEFKSSSSWDEDLVCCKSECLMRPGLDVVAEVICILCCAGLPFCKTGVVKLILSSDSTAGLYESSDSDLAIALTGTAEDLVLLTVVPCDVDGTEMACFICRCAADPGSAALARSVTSMLVWEPCVVFKPCPQSSGLLLHAVASAD